MVNLVVSWSAFKILRNTMFLFKFKIKTLILIYLNYLSVILIFLEKSIKYYLTSRKDNRMKEKRKPKKKVRKTHAQHVRISGSIA